MNYITIYGAALLLALLIASPALDKYNLKPFGDWRPKPWRSLLRGLWACEQGAVTVTYYIRGGNTVINGSTTGPTTAQAAQLVKQSAVVVFGVLADIQALFTHNWGLDLSAGPFYEPELAWEPISTDPGNSGYAMVTFLRVNSNVVSANKINGQVATTGVLTLRKPHSLGM
jgi:hypothetical protein